MCFRAEKEIYLIMKKLFFLFLIAMSLQIVAQPPTPIPVGTMLPTRQVPVHDPVMIKQGNTYYVFCTGLGIAVWSSKDLKMWRKEAPVFSEAPQWAVDTIPGFKGHIWAPDISYQRSVLSLLLRFSIWKKHISDWRGHQ